MGLEFIFHPRKRGMLLWSGLLVVLIIVSARHKNNAAHEISFAFPYEESRTSAVTRSLNFLYYPNSRAYNEHIRIHYFATIARSAAPNFTVIHSTNHEYSVSVFRAAPYPILWLDEYGDVHWNLAAERETLIYLENKQFPASLEDSKLNRDALTQKYLHECEKRQLIIMVQWVAGFFSRMHCFIEMFGQTLYSPSMAVLAPARFVILNAGRDDFLGEGILRHIAPMSLCSAYMHLLKSLDTQIRYLTQSNVTTQNNALDIISMNQWRYHKKKFMLLRDFWRLGYEHVPLRKWLFDRDRLSSQRKVTYSSSLRVLSDHSSEHIYQSPNLSFDLKQWTASNRPLKEPFDYVPSWQDRVFTSFLRYMFLIFFSPLAPRIEASTRLLTEHWSIYLGDMHDQPYNESLRAMVTLFIRRGDKAVEDSFYRKHGYWRNISLFVKGIVDEEHRRGIRFKSLFVVTDEAEVMTSIQDYSNLDSSGTGEQYARQHLKGRHILFNVFAPQACFNPYEKIGYDQFLVSVSFALRHSSFVVAHNDSNIGRYFQEMFYATKQHNPGVQTQTFVKNPPDILS
ncbi:unnamed protein product [Rotaria socialis]|uniref:Uncharacterized protein n=3 Tax=Rotaria socialis TaxID=392032 RepID=A0A820HRX3_9BILA|nr:unnamed protein product [Rotaria socialis]CAF4297905.1 unnamed protein product [Rotaria socialis]